MSTTFTNTIRSLKSDRSYLKGTGLVLAVIVLGAWIAWFCWGRVSVYEFTESARLEVSSRVRPVVALVPGQVVHTQMSLGKTVQAEEVLVQLDDRTEQLVQEEGQTKLVDLRRRLVAVASKIEAEKQAVLDHRVANTAFFDEHNARIKEAQARTKFTDWQYGRTHKLLQT